MYRTIGYRIEAVAIEQTPGMYRKTWLLDAVQVGDDGQRSTSNICSGSDAYCRDTLRKINNENLPVDARQ